MPEIEDIIETTEHAPLFLWWQWLLLSLLALLILLIVRQWANHLRRHPNSTSTETPIQRAYREIKDLGKIPLPQREQASALSIIIRRYLSQRYNIPALYQTREEFLSNNPNIEKLPDTASIKVRQFLDQLHQLKYAPITNESSSNQLGETHKLLTSLESIPIESKTTEKYGD